MPFTHLEVVGVMGRGNLYYTGTELHIHIGICHNWHFAVYQRKQHLPSD